MTLAEWGQRHGTCPGWQPITLTEADGREMIWLQCLTHGSYFKVPVLQHDVIRRMIQDPEYHVQ